MLPVRLIKIAMVASCALHALLVTLGNLTDYDTNHQFVRHTLSMDTTFPGNALMGRAITAPWVWSAAYWLIIAAEAVTGLVLTVAAARLALCWRAPAQRFNGAKSLVMVGAGIGFLLWFTGFMVIGGEWFAMWQSKTWNGQQAAFRFYLTLLGVMIFVNQPDGEWEGTSA